MDGDHELFKMDDVKVEVMRARGAGGQVGLWISSILANFDHLPSARKQNRVCSPSHPYTHWCHRFNARRAQSTSGNILCPIWLDL